MQDRYRGAELLPVLLQHLNWERTWHWRGDRAGVTAPLAPVCRCILDTQTQTGTVASGHAFRDPLSSPFYDVYLLFSFLEGKKPFKTLGEILSHYGNLPTAKQRCLPPRGQFIHWPLPSHYRLQPASPTAGVLHTAAYRLHTGHQYLSSEFISNLKF